VKNNIQKRTVDAHFAGCTIYLEWNGKKELGREMKGALAALKQERITIAAETPRE
jgi:hypothetical protein